MIKLHCRFVCETQEYREFFYINDANAFTKKMTDQGYHVLSGIGYTE